MRTEFVHLALRAINIRDPKLNPNIWKKLGKESRSLRRKQLEAIKRAEYSNKPKKKNCDL